MSEATPAAVSTDARAILVAARELIADPAQWCRGSWARTDAQLDTGPVNREATQWCAVGAVWRTSEHMPGPAFRLAVDRGTQAARAAGYGSLSEANDRLDHAGVLAILDAALASLAEPDITS